MNLNDFKENDAVRMKKPKAEKIPLLFDSHELSEQMATELIREYHPHLATARIQYICRNKATKKAGKPVPGRVFKMAPMYQHLTNCDFVMEIALECWNDLSPNQRVALVDHLLYHFQGEEKEETGDMVWKLVRPEIQEFPEVAERRGQWHEGLVELEKCLRDKNS